MNERESNLLRELARTASDMGAALVPPGHLELLRSITSAARSLFNAAACSLALLEEEREELVFHVASGEGADEVIGLRIPASQGIAGWVVTSGQPIAIEDVQSDARFARDAAESTGYVPRSILAMPLETERRMVGVISVLDRSADGRDTRRDMEMLGLFANQAALAIETSQVFSSLGAALLEAAARAHESDEDLSESLRALAAEAPAGSRDLVELAGLFNELGARGPEERALATRVLVEFLQYLRARGRWTT